MSSLKDIDFQILSELMKNSKMSDRELAKKLGVSKLTVNRRRIRLEQKRIIKEYTLIPDFTKLGYEIMAMTFVKLKETLSREKVEEARRLSHSLAKESPKEWPFNIILAERGMGLGYNGIFVSLHENYDSFLKHKEWLRQFAFFEMQQAQSFLINLHEEIHYLSIPFSNLARHLALMKETKEKEMP